MPCIAIVIATSFSFIIPLSAIPGRVALIVTQFLTLTNIFINQMVSSMYTHSSIISNDMVTHPLHANIIIISIVLRLKVHPEKH